MHIFKNVTVLRRSPLIVIADAIALTPVGIAFLPPSGCVEFEGAPHLLQIGSARGANLPGIKPGEPMLMQLRKA